MVFFGDVDRDVVGRPADQVLESFLANSSVMPAKIMALVGRKYIVEVTVSKYSCRRDKDGLSFQVLKFFTEAGFMYHDFVVGVGSSSSAPMQQVPFSGRCTYQPCRASSGYLLASSGDDEYSF
uniref:Uncharacterized protein n=1 Tax=Aegilops tauschii subsp. strangulata TaxID=200361 RepID=A0A453M6N4_AEGTS